MQVGHKPSALSIQTLVSTASLVFGVGRNDTHTHGAYLRAGILSLLFQEPLKTINF